ncbi:MAG: glycosyltransferase family 2 protein [Bacteriovoracaceae bacterium]|nr:glycosyltransferase family 2 protein [Bacteriovoracaceae bacterium]
MKYSIIVCAYNEEENIGSCLRSLKKALEGHGNDVEVIVVDNSSSDNTAREILKIQPIFEGLCLFTKLRIDHVPLSISRNTGISQSSGEFLIFIDADALVHKQWFAKLKACVEANPEKLVFSGKVENLSSKDSDFSNTYYRMIIEPSQMAGGSRLIGANMALKKSCIEEVGGFSRVTSVRGDEVFVLKKLIVRYGAKIEHFCEDSIIYNQFPNTYFQMLKIVRAEAYSFASILFYPKVRWRELCMRTIMASSWLFGTLLILKSLWLALGVWSLRLALRYRFYRNSFMCCTKYSRVEALGSIPVNTLNILIFDNVFLCCVLRLFFRGEGSGDSVFFEKGEVLKKL